MLPKVIVVTGPEGSGKSVTACGLAASVGTYNTTTMQELRSGPFALGRVMRGSPETIIVDECGLSPADITKMKELTAHEETAVHQMGEDTHVEDTPRFIFVMSPSAKPRILEESRRFVEVVLQGD